MNDNPNQKLIEAGVGLLVRKIFCQVMLENIGKTEEETREVISEVNTRLLAEFKVLAQDSFNKVLEQADTLLKEAK